MEQRRQTWAWGWQEGLGEQRWKEKSIRGEDGGAVMENHQDFVMDAEKGISRC